MRGRLGLVMLGMLAGLSDAWAQPALILYYKSTPDTTHEAREIRSAEDVLALVKTPGARQCIAEQLELLAAAEDYDANKHRITGVTILFQDYNGSGSPILDVGLTPSRSPELPERAMLLRMGTTSGCVMVSSERISDAIATEFAAYDEKVATERAAVSAVEKAVEKLTKGLSTPAGGTVPGVATARVAPANSPRAPAGQSERFLGGSGAAR